MARTLSRPATDSLPPLVPENSRHTFGPISSDSHPGTPDQTSATSSSLTTGSSGDMERHRSVSSGPSGRTSVSPTKEKEKEQSKVELGDFDLIRVLGKGCAGRVLLVRHSGQNSVHAMKAVSKRSVLATDELVHILTELSILKRFAVYEPDNDFVTKLNYAFTDRENFYFVMDFYPGGDLATQLEMHGKLGEIRTRFYAADLVLGLEDLHRHGVIVRDLKPENILLNSAGHCVIADFGLSKEFEYRGDPQPIHVPSYEGEMVLPPWAGAGMGSIRPSPMGKPRITMDRTWSFVGTTEYLSPEVVLGQEYTYAVDWWGLGCILFECLIGRVPFRKNDDEPPQVMYNRILYEPWDYIFSEPRYSRSSRTKLGLDPVTESFFDGLLQKDPMRRLTEPCVREHYYFTHIDWELVRDGHYVDPHQLQLHPLAEYNTRYFPKLCIEQEPSVDMSTHNREDMEAAADTDYGRKLSALNDDDTYKFEQLKHRKELEQFYWNREEHEWPEEEVLMDEDVADSGAAEEEVRTPSSSVEAAEGGADGDAEVRSLVPTEVDEEPAMEADVGRVEAAEEVTVKIDSTLPPGDPLAVGTPVLGPFPLSGAMSSMQLSSPVASPERLITPDASSRDIPIRIEDHSDPDVSPTKTDADAPAKPEQADAPVIPLPVESLPAPERIATPTISLPIPPSPSTTSLSPTTIPELPVATRLGAVPKPIPIPVLRPKPEVPLTRLPSGLPASGLSSSDVMAIPSPGLDAPRLVRRHRQLASIDSIPAARLSVEMNGTRTQLGEDDWEALDSEWGADTPSAPNGYGPSVPPSSFFNRLRRRPSAIITSGLRRQTQTRSTSDSSRESSPTKSVLRPAIFGGTKKALDKLKAFPLLRSRRNSDESEPATTLASGLVPSVSPSPSAKGLSPPKLSRPEGVRRHTESGWFERKLSRSRYVRGGKRSLTQSSEGSTGGDSGWGGGSEDTASKRKGGPPRVELKSLGSPVDWEFKLGRPSEDVGKSGSAAGPPKQGGR